MIKRNVSMLLIFSYSLIFSAGPIPIQFSISQSKIVDKIPQKDRDFAFLIPGFFNTYIYSDEPTYYHDYQRAYFAFTRKKGGWDCMRHYEILANGCIPYFINLGQCHPKTMALLPRKLILEAMNLPGIMLLDEGGRLSPKIDHEKFDKKRYYEILHQLLEYTRTHLTTESMARYLLEKVNYKGGSILFLSEQTTPDYQRECTLTGLKQILGNKVTDYPKIDYLYKSYSDDIRKLYGKGFSYTRVLDDIFVDRENIAQRIGDKEFELVIYGSVHRGLPLHDLVRQYYSQDNIVYICGEDHREQDKETKNCSYCTCNNLFLREFDAAG